MNSHTENKTTEIKPIPLDLPYRLGAVNCFLVRTADGSVLVDTGCSYRRKQLVETLEKEGVAPGNLRLILLTHGDFDHSGNAAFTREKYNAKIGIHPGDAGMVQNGDMSCNRRKGKFYLRWLAPLMFGYGRAARFEPDLVLQDGMDLSALGLDAMVISTPGHSKGSICLHLAQGDLLCGDLLENTGKPSLSEILDNPQEAAESLKKISKYKIDRVYPGHGAVFAMQDLSSVPV